MGSGLIKLGMLVLAAALVALLLSSRESETTEWLAVWAQPGLFAGALMVAAGIALHVVGRVGRAALPTRCARCGASVARGQVYCADHLKATVDEARDHLHMRNLDRGSQG